MTLREAVQKLVQHDGWRLRRPHWSLDVVEFSTSEQGHVLYWVESKTLVVLESADILASDWEVIEPQEATG